MGARFREGLQPKFVTFQDFITAVEKFNKENKHNILIAEFKYFSDCYNLQNDCWCLPDLGKKINISWDVFCFDLRNDISISNRNEFWEEEKRKKERKERLKNLFYIELCK